MKILGVLLAFVGFALGIYEIINTLRGKENKRILCGVAIAYLGYGVCYSSWSMSCAIQCLKKIWGILVLHFYLG